MPDPSRYWPPEPAPVRDPNPEITVITGLEGPLPRPVWRMPPEPQPDEPRDGEETPPRQ
ncbi:hypothetical protein [Streptomyces avicenniae]|uniref:hypothetical protein n=1 Tax=Streptomyces avicenniae TaxID=500153 RepID=UPI000A8E822B|nr:hypothetical protein [Streptomyces avicenniae]